jgi:copper oxidase (laccase) domain-containing protein
MHDLFGTQGRDLIAAIGPSVCQESYEVGTEVIQAVHTAFGRDHTLLQYLSNGKARLDLWEANRLQLLSFGVRAEMIEISNFCTVKRNTDFFSARVGDTGRFAAGIALV